MRAYRALRYILKGIFVPDICPHFCYLCPGHEVSGPALLHGLCIYQLPHHRLKSNDSLNHRLKFTTVKPNKP